MNSTTRMTKGINFSNNIIWFVIVLLLAVITGTAIADEKWLYFIIPLIPLILYLFIHKPFIFPFGLYVLLLPFDQVLSITGSAQGATLTKFLGILTILVLSIKGALENKLKKPDAASILFMLYVLYGVMSLNWAIRPELGLGFLQTYVGLLVLYLVVASYKIQRADFETLKWCIVIGGVLSAIYSVYSYQSTASNVAIERGAALGVADRSSNFDSFAISLVLPASLCIQMLLEQKNRIIKISFGFAIGVILFAIVLCGSRGVMLGVGVAIIIYIFSLKKKISVWVILVTVGIVLIPFIPDFVIERWGESMKTGGSGRLDIWYLSLSVLRKYYMFGAGLLNFPDAYSEIATELGVKKTFRAAHNVYLQTFCELGILGITLLILVIIKHYKAIQRRVIQYKYNHVMLKAALSAMVVSSFFNSFINSKSFWLIFMMIMMHKNISEDVSEERLRCNQREAVSSKQ